MGILCRCEVSGYYCLAFMTVLLRQFKPRGCIRLCFLYVCSVGMV